MSRIKSALEIALEKTEGIKIDRHELEMKDAVEGARKIIGAWVSNGDGDYGVVKKNLVDITPSIVTKAIKESLPSFLTLPQSDQDTERMKRFGEVFKDFVHKDDAKKLYDDLVGFLSQYPKHRDQLIEDLQKQAEPILREREAELSKKYGQHVQLRIEDDKELLEAVRHQMDMLTKRYEETLSQTKSELEKMMDNP